MERSFTFETLIFIVLFIYVLFTLRKNDSQEIFSRSSSNYLRGLFAAIIIIFHISKKTDLLYGVFGYHSITVVGAFFFLSGYGSMKQYLLKDDYYLSYPKKRFFGVILPYLIMTGIYWLYSFYTGEYYSFSEVLQRMITFAPIVTYSWFIISIIVHYFIFYILLVICKTNRKLFVSSYLVLLGIGVALVLSGSRHTTLCDAMFALGILYAYKEKEVNGYFDRYKLIIALISFVITIVMNMVDIEHNELFNFIEKLLYMSMLISFLHFFRFESRFMNMLGNISMEIYMCQGLAKMLVRRFVGGSLFVQDMFIYILCFVLAFVFHKLFVWIRKIFVS